MNRPKLPARYAKQTKANRTPPHRDLSPLSQFTHLNIEELEGHKLKSSSKYVSTPLTPQPPHSETRTPSVTQMQRDPLSQRKNHNILQSKQVTYQSGKKKHMDSTTNQSYLTQNSLQHNYMSETLRGTAIQNLVNDLKRKQKENSNNPCMYGLGKTHSPNESKELTKNKFLQLTLMSKEFSKRKPQSFYHEDENENHSGYIKVKTQINTASKNSPSPLQHCHFHQDKKAKYYRRDDRGINYQLCSQCAILHASKQLTIYRLHDHSKVTQEVQDWAISPRGEPQCQDQKQKLADMQIFMDKTSTVNNSINFLVNQIHSADDPQISNKIAVYMSRILLPHLESFVLQRIGPNILPKDVMVKVSEQLQEIQEELITIKNDISSNMDNIINNMEMRPFRMILQKYNIKVDTFEASISNIFGKLNKNFGVPNPLEMIEHIKLKLAEPPKKNQQQVYISFENKDSFVAAMGQTEPKIESVTNDSIILRSSETQKFLDYLQIRTENEKTFQSQQSQGEQSFKKFQKNLLLSPNFNE